MNHDVLTGKMVDSILTPKMADAYNLTDAHLGGTPAHRRLSLTLPNGRWTVHVKGLFPHRVEPDKFGLIQVWASHDDGYKSNAITTKPGDMMRIEDLILTCSRVAPARTLPLFQED